MKKGIIKFNHHLYLYLIFTLIAFVQSQDKSNEPSLKVISQLASIINIFSNNQCKLPQRPKKLAIATVTRFRATGQNDLKQGIAFFKQYLTKYAQMDCDVFDSIYLIWNNDKAPEQYPTLLDDKEKWKKNVYFIQTKFNSMDHRFAFPPWVPEEVFMSLDDDADIDCENIKKSFSQWQDHFIGGLGPFGAVQMSGRTMEYKMQQDKFEYKYGTKSYISMALPNIGIISRHFYDLYYANLPQFQKMRNLVSELSNCDDIGLNFMIGYIYPQLRPVAFKDITAITKPFNIQINKTPTHGQKRNDCLNKFSEILGENTWSYNIINRNNEYEKIKQDPLRKYECILALKRSIIQQKYLNNDHYYNFMNNIYYYNFTQIPNQLISQINSDRYIFSLSQKVRDDLVQSKKINLQYRSKHSVQSIFGAQAVSENILASSNEFKNVEQQNKILISNLDSLQNQFQTLKTILIVTNLFMIIVILRVLLRFAFNSRSQKQHKTKGQMIEENYSTEMQYTGETVRITEMK